MRGADFVMGTREPEDADGAGGLAGGGPRPGANGWHPSRFGRAVPHEIGEWLAFAVLRVPGTECPLRDLVASQEVFAACEGHPAVSELALVRHLEALGIRRRGATFLDLRIYAEIPAVRLLTRLEIYGYRFAARDGELAWRAPAVVTDLERRVIERHRADLAAAVERIAENRAAIRGRRMGDPLVCPRGLPLRAA